MAVTRDGARLAVGTSDGRALILDARTGATTWEFDAEGRALSGLAFDGPSEALVGSCGALFVWDLRGGIERERHPRAELLLDLLPDGGQALLADAPARRVGLYDLAHRAFRWTETSLSMRASLSRDGRVALVPMEGRRLRLLDVARGVALDTFAIQTTGTLRTARLLSDGRTLLALSDELREGQVGARALARRLVSRASTEGFALSFDERTVAWVDRARRCAVVLERGTGRLVAALDDEEARFRDVVLARRDVLVVSDGHLVAAHTWA